MPTATDYGSTVSTVGFVPYELMEGTQAQVVNVGSEMTDVSTPTDAQGGGSFAHSLPQTQHTTFSQMTDSMGSSDKQLSASQEAFEHVPQVYKMRGYSTTLGQYVYWRSHGDALTPAPAEYGTVINVSSELVQ